MHFNTSFTALFELHSWEHYYVVVVALFTNRPTINLSSCVKGDRDVLGGGHPTTGCCYLLWGFHGFHGSQTLQMGSLGSWQEHLVC